MTSGKGSLPLFTSGDLNAFFALFLDNVVNLVILAGILMGFGFPKDIIFGKMIPGTALGVLIGDGVYTYMAYRLAKKTGRDDVTAMPLGLDTPSTIGIAFTVLVPAFLFFKGQGNSADQAGLFAWYVGMATMLWMGGIKVVTALLGEYIQKLVPAAGLLGSIAGIGLVWLAANQFIKTMEIPLVGLVAMGFILITMVARYKLPWNIPGAAAAVVIGALVYYVSASLDVFGVKGCRWSKKDRGD